MNQLIYCYDAYCGWCYGFSPVIKQVFEKYKSTFAFEVLSGGMIISDPRQHIRITAGYIKDSYRQVETHTGIRFGKDYLWHILNPDESDWFPDSRKPAIAMTIFKEMFPALQVVFASELQYALFEEGRDLCDNEAYRHLLERYHIEESEFYTKLALPEYAEKAQYEFALVKQLQVTGYPAVLFQESESKFHLLAKGYTDFDTLDSRIRNVLGLYNTGDDDNRK